MQLVDFDRIDFGHWRSLMPQFERYRLTGAGPLAPVFRGRGPVIYILEFENGERYVGQTIDMVARYASHRRRWGDIVAVQVRDTSATELTAIERRTINKHRAAGHSLRNISYNLGHAQRSPLDALIPPVDQKHWATGEATYDYSTFAEAASRPPGPEAKLVASQIGREQLPDGRTVAQAVIDDLAVVVALGIPEAVSTEQTYWTVTDFPSTAGGRLATLNVGNMEVLYFPRGAVRFGGETVPRAILNLAPGFHVPRRIGGVNLGVRRNQTSYKAAPAVDQFHFPVGQLSASIEESRAIEALRELVLALMRSGTAAKFARWHSLELARLVYASVGEWPGAKVVARTCSSSRGTIGGSLWRWFRRR